MTAGEHGRTRTCNLRDRSSLLCPIELRVLYLVPVAGLEPARPQSLRLGRLPISPDGHIDLPLMHKSLEFLKSGATGMDSNPRPAHYKRAALPTELRRHCDVRGRKAQPFKRERPELA